MNLYEIDNELMNCVDSETGEIIDEEKLDSLQMERDRKIEGLCMWIKDLNAKTEALKAEKDAFDKRMKSAKNKADSLKKYLTSVLDGNKFETTKVSVSFRKSESLEITDNGSIPYEYLKFKDPDIDKAGLKKAIKGGLEIGGVQIVEKQNIQII